MPNSRLTNLTTGNIEYNFNLYFSPSELDFLDSRKIVMLLPHRYLDCDNSKVMIGSYKDYLVAREERLNYMVKR